MSLRSGQLLLLTLEQDSTERTKKRKVYAIRRHDGSLYPQKQPETALMIALLWDENFMPSVQLNDVWWRRVMQWLRWPWHHTLSWTLFQ